MAANPLVRVVGLQQLLQRDAPPAPPVDALGGPEVESALAGHVRLAWGRNKLAKERIDRKLLQDLRARRGVYSPAEIGSMQAANGGANIVWAPISETKCRAASAWIREILLPVGEQPWGVDPSPVPDLPMELKNAVVNKACAKAREVLVQAGQAGGGIMDPGEFRDLVLQLGEKLRDEAELTYKRIALLRAERMQKVIADRLIDGDYQQAMDGFVEDFVTYPAAILKGPIYTRHKQLEWDKTSWKPKVVEKTIQTWFRVSPFDAYPSPAATTPQKGDFIERIRYRRDEMHALKGLPGYKDDQIDLALRDYTNGHLEGWLWTESERQRLEQETMFMWLSPSGVIDAVNYWGSVPGWKLMSWGVEGNLDETCEYECNVLLCGRYVLYAALNPNPVGNRPYRKACYDEIPGAFWGRSIPDLAFVSQQMCNAVACALANNLAIASGPQAWVHMDRLADGEQSLDMFPWKVWQLKSDPTQGVNPGVGFFQPDDRAAALNDTYDKWELKADDATGIPRYTYGNEHAGGSADTASGLSMLMNNAAKGLRRAISNADLHVIGPTIEDTFVNEMIYNADESIKGDNVIVPRGAAAILIRESAQQRRLQFLTLTANPIDAPIIGAKHRAALLREVARALELDADEIVPTDDEIDAMQQAQGQAMESQQQKLQAYEVQKEQAIAQREQSAQQTKALGDIVKTAVASSMQAANKQESATA